MWSNLPIVELVPRSLQIHKLAISSNESSETSDFSSHYLLQVRFHKRFCQFALFRCNLLKAAVFF